MRTIRFYTTEPGRTPIEEFLDSLDGKQAKKVAWVLQLIEDLETVPNQYFQKLVNTDAIWEVRVQFGGNIFRLLSFLDGATLVILTNGFAKKTQKTPMQEIKLAEQRKANHLEQQRHAKRQQAETENDYE